MSVSIDPRPLVSPLTADDLLRIARDPEFFQKRLDEIKAAQAELQKRIDVLGPVEEIERLQSEAASHERETKTAMEQARKTLTDAQEEARGIVERSKTEAQEHLDTVTRETQRMIAEARDIATRAEASKRDAEDRHRSLTEQHEKIGRLQSELEAKHAEADIQREALAAKHRRVDAAIAALKE